MIVYNYPADGMKIPTASIIHTKNNITFNLNVSAPGPDGLSNITVTNLIVQKFYVRNITYLVARVYLWSELLMLAPGNGTLDTTGGHQMGLDVYTTVKENTFPNGTASGGYTRTVVINNNKTGTSRVGDQIVSIPVKLHYWSGKSPTNSTSTGVIDDNVNFTLYLTTGFTRTITTGPAYPARNSTAFDQQMNATGVPANPLTGIFTAVTSQAGLNILEKVLSVNLLTDFIFKEYLQGTPNPAIPAEPIRSTSVTPLFPRWGSTLAVYQGDSINFSATIYNGLNVSSIDIGTTSIQNTTGSYPINVTSAIKLGAGSTIVVWFVWNSTKTSNGGNVAYGNYTITLAVNIKVTINGKLYTTTDTQVYSSKLFITIPGDINLDGKVNTTDFLLFLVCYGHSKGESVYNPACDLNRDGKVDFSDFLLFLANYGKSW
jgi:hypothetical protein